MTKRDVPAFPRHYELLVGSRLEENERTLLRSEEGMTLRDYFAGQALIGCIRSMRHVDGLGDAEFFAKHSYLIADAMLKAREEAERE